LGLFYVVLFSVRTLFFFRSEVWRRRRRRRRGGQSGALAGSSRAKGHGLSDNEVDLNG
jgi:hypothetical protein